MGQSAQRLNRSADLTRERAAHTCAEQGKGIGKALAKLQFRVRQARVGAQGLLAVPVSVSHTPETPGREPTKEGGRALGRRQRYRPRPAAKQHDDIRATTVA